MIRPSGQRWTLRTARSGVASLRWIWVLVIIVVAAATSCTTTGSPPPPETSGDPPTIELPALEDRYNQCLATEGFKRRSLEDGTWVVELAPEQRDRYVAAVRRCAEEVGLVTPGEPAPLSEEQLRSLYDGYLEVSSCLSELGYPVPQAPSVDSFVDAGGSGWTPWDMILDRVDEEERKRITRECPHP